jgi:hypothetical protein
MFTIIRSNEFSNQSLKGPGILLVLLILSACRDFLPGNPATATPTAAPSEPVAAPTTWPELETWLAAAWLNNLNPAAVRYALQQAGWQDSYDDWLAADFDGDLRDEWALLLYPPGVTSESVFGRPGNLWIVNGGGLIYRHYESVNTESGEDIAPDFVGLADLTGNNLPELVIDEHVCGAHTCYGNYQILSSANGSIENIVRRQPENDVEEANVISVSYPDTYFADHQQDGHQDFIVNGGAIGSVGAGIVRTYTEVWSWDGTDVVLTEVIPDYTQYRHHILYEANERMAAGELDQALLLYEQAINDSNLLTPEFSHTQTETYQAISQLAAFRLILLDLLANDPNRAQSRVTWLQSNYPGTASAQAAAALVQNWTGPEGMAALCATIEAEIQALPNPTGALADLGYGNPTLTAADLCP